MAGDELGTGSSRDWAAKGTDLLGIRATIGKSYERIYRDNLIGMGVLPLQFEAGEGWEELGLEGDEYYELSGLEDGLEPNAELDVTAEDDDGDVTEFTVTAQSIRRWLSSTSRTAACSTSCSDAAAGRTGYLTPIH